MKSVFKFMFASLLAVTSVTVSCTKDEEAVTPADVQEVNLDIILSDIKDVEAHVQIVPDNNDVSYYWGVMTAEEYSALDGADALYELNMAYFQQLADERGVSVETIVSEQTVTGTTLRTLTDLSSLTEYVVYGYALSNDGHGSKVSAESFTTLDGGAAEEEPRVRVQIDEARMTQVDVTYTPDDMSVTYYPNYIDDATYQSYGGDIRGVIKYFNETLQYSADLYEVTVEELVATLINRGVKEDTYDYLIPLTTYWFFVAEIDEHGEVLSIDCQPATTTERVMSGVTFDIEIDSVWQTSIHAKVIPSDPDELYYMSLFPKSDFETLGGAVSGEAFMQTVIDRLGADIQDGLYSGDMIGYFWNLTPDVEYVLVAFTCGEAWTSELFKTETKTVGVIDPKDLKIDITFPYISEVQIQAVLEPNDPLVPYHYSYMTKEEYESYSSPEEAAQAGFDYYVDLWVDYYKEWGDTREEVIGYLTRYGTRLYTETNLLAGTEYVIWAGSFTPEGILQSKPFIAEFRTLDWHTDESITVEPVVGKYFDAGAIHRFYNGKVFQIIEDINLSDNVDTLYIACFKGDYTDKSDDWVAAHLIISGMKNPKDTLIAMTLDPEPYTLCAIGQDADGNWGPAFLQYLELDPSGYSDPSEFPQSLLADDGMLRPVEYTSSPLLIPEPELEMQTAAPLEMPAPAREQRTAASVSETEDIHVFPMPSAPSQPEALPSFRIE